MVYGRGFATGRKREGGKSSRRQADTDNPPKNKKKNKQRALPDFLSKRKVRMGAHRVRLPGTLAKNVQCSKKKRGALGEKARFDLFPGWNNRRGEEKRCEGRGKASQNLLKKLRRRAPCGKKRSKTSLIDSIGVRPSSVKETEKEEGNQVMPELSSSMGREREPCLGRFYSAFYCR